MSLPSHSGLYRNKLIVVRRTPRDSTQATASILSRRPPYFMLDCCPCGAIVRSYFTDFSFLTVTIAVAMAAYVMATSIARQAHGDSDVMKHEV